MVILGIETSCDETSAAVLVDGAVKSNIISSQHIHALYGGVVPELASRAHMRLIVDVVNAALNDAGVPKGDLSAIAATQGPGLVGALLVGLNFGKALSYGLDIPFIGVNHLEGHLYSNFLVRPAPSYPFLALVVSGGHTMLVLVEKEFHHRLLGETLDDAAGEAFDKVGKMLGLGYPGGPIIDKIAATGNPRAIPFPRSYLGEGYSFSFSGIKTAVLYFLKKEGISDPGRSVPTIAPARLADICASFQAAIVEVLVAKTFRAAEEFAVRDIILAGGVSANSELRRLMQEQAGTHGVRVFHPPMEYCMDNAAMIAFTGYLRFRRGERSGMDLSAIANLPISQVLQ